MRAGSRSWLDARIVLPVVLIVLTTVYLVGAFDIAAPYEDEGVGAAFFPIVLAIVMYAALAVVLVQGIRDAGVTAPTILRLGPPAKVVLLTAIYVALFRPIGYFASTIIYVYALFFVFNFGSANHLKRLAAAVAVAVAFFLLFETGFGVRLPTIWE